MNVTVKVSGTKECTAALLRFKTAFKAAVDAAVESVANGMYANVVDTVPIDEGNLQKSTYVAHKRSGVRSHGADSYATKRGAAHLALLNESWSDAESGAQSGIMGSSKLIARVGTAAYYAKWVHEGHHNVPPRQYLTMALDVAADEMPNVVERHIAKAIENAREEFTIE